MCLQMNPQVIIPLMSLPMVPEILYHTNKTYNCVKVLMLICFWNFNLHLTIKTTGKSLVQLPVYSTLLTMPTQ